MYNLSEYFDFTRINDKDYCESKDLIVKKNTQSTSFKIQEK